MIQATTGTPGVLVLCNCSSIKRTRTGLSDPIQGTAQRAVPHTLSMCAHNQHSIILLCVCGGGGGVPKVCSALTLHSNVPCAAEKALEPSL